jgi:hypothetical protein
VEGTPEARVFVLGEKVNGLGTDRRGTTPLKDGQLEGA